MQNLTLKQCQSRLLLIWLIGLCPSVVLMATESILGKFSGHEQEIWSWFIPMFLPTVTLMIGAYAKVALEVQPDTITVDSFFFKISQALSIFYLLSLLLVICLQPFVNAPILTVFQRSSFFLVLVQGLITACLGVFFMSQKPKE